MSNRLGRANRGSCVLSRCSFPNFRRVLISVESRPGFFREVSAEINTVALISDRDNRHCQRRPPISPRRTTGRQRQAIRFEAEQAVGSPVAEPQGSHSRTPWDSPSLRRRSGGHFWFARLGTKPFSMRSAHSERAIRSSGGRPCRCTD
jgi:hypothetical protein